MNIRWIFFPSATHLYKNSDFSLRAEHRQCMHCSSLSSFFLLTLFLRAAGPQPWAGDGGWQPGTAVHTRVQRMLLQGLVLGGELPGCSCKTKPLTA